MRLLRQGEDGDFSLNEFFGEDIPPYAILSHTWGADCEEVNYKDIAKRKSTTKRKAGYAKLQFCGAQAQKDGLQYFWVDTCCIDKSSSSELTEAINSMFRWYRDSIKCYVYLSDVSVRSKRWKPAFKKSRWFTRGWTLQELIAPKSVQFFAEGQLLGDKKSLEQTLHEITRIPIQVLRGSSLSEVSVEDRFSWAEERHTKREEDDIYSLLGIFDIHMPLIYGEGRERAKIRLQDEINKSRKLKPLSLEEKRELLLQSLKFSQIDARQTTIKDAHAKTCKWLLEKTEYVEWLDLTKPRRFLWIKGKPGTGKSTIMKFALANACQTIQDKTIISFFFNARGEDLEKSTVGTYRSLLLQLLEAFPKLSTVLDSVNVRITGSIAARDIIKTHQWSVEVLKMLLKQTIGRLVQPVVCFIDALDECDDSQIRDMISFFESISDFTKSAGNKFRVCFSSRHYPHITLREGLGKNLVLEGQEGHNEDITNYLDSVLKIGHSKVAQDIRVQIQERASGVFIWVVLVVGILNKEYDRGRIHALQRRLREIPDDLYELFRDILTRDSECIPELVLCIQWVLFATRPLSPEELYFVICSGLASETSSPFPWDPVYTNDDIRLPFPSDLAYMRHRIRSPFPWNSREITGDDIKRFILDSSKGLTEVTRSSLPTVQFIHESVREFLEKDGLAKILLKDTNQQIWPDLANDFRGQSHERLKQSCLIYMNCHENDRRVYRPIKNYAKANVLYHANMAAGSGIPQDFLPKFPFRNAILEQNERGVEKHTPLYILAALNMSNLIRVHPDIDSITKVEDAPYGCPLLAALATGSTQVGQVLLEVYSKDQRLQSQLQEHYSKAYQHESEQDSFRHDFIFSEERTVLSYLAECGESRILTTLLGAGQIDVNEKAALGKSTLDWAAENGREALVGFLISTDQVIVDSMDDGRRTPLSKAAMNGHGAVVKLLLDTGRANPDSMDDDRRTPLSEAAMNGHEAIVKLLLDTGRVNPDSKDTCRRTPLLEAVMNEHQTVVKLLLDTAKVNPNSRDGWGRTPLWIAIEGGHAAMVELLLETGQVDVNAKNDMVGRTPLMQAAMTGNDAVVELLVDTGQLDVNAKDIQGRTALWLATAHGHEEVVRLLLDVDQVDVDLRDRSGETPMSYPGADKNKAIIKMLLERDVIF